MNHALHGGTVTLPSVCLVNSKLVLQGCAEVMLVVAPASAVAMVYDQTHSGVSGNPETVAAAVVLSVSDGLIRIYKVSSAQLLL